MRFISKGCCARQGRRRPTRRWGTGRPGMRSRARLGEQGVQEFIRQAETAAGEAIPALPATLWLECLRTGRREGYEDPCYRRRTMLRDLALGECLEHRGRFIDPLLDVIWAICEESGWVYPAHQLPDWPIWTGLTSTWAQPAPGLSGRGRRAAGGGPAPPGWGAYPP